MNLLITAHHFQLTPAIRQYVEEKVERLTRHFDEVREIEVVLVVEENADKDRRQRAEMNVRVKGDTLHGQSDAQDIYAALDSVLEKMDRQVARYKDKVQDHNNTAVKHLQP